MNIKNKKSMNKIKPNINVESKLVSENEEDETILLLQETKVEIEELLQDKINQAYQIGGSFRGPGIKNELKKLLQEQLNRI